MDDWSKEVHELVTKHSNRTNDIDVMLRTLINQNKLNVKCEVTPIDKINQIWNIKIDTKEFTLTNKEILDQETIQDENYNEYGVPIISNDKKNDSEKAIKVLILKKIQ